MSRIASEVPCETENGDFQTHENNSEYCCRVCGFILFTETQVASHSYTYCTKPRSYTLSSENNERFVQSSSQPKAFRHKHYHQAREYSPNCSSIFISWNNSHDEPPRASEDLQIQSDTETNGSTTVSSSRNSVFGAPESENCTNLEPSAILSWVRNYVHARTLNGQLMGDLYCPSSACNSIVPTKADVKNGQPARSSAVKVGRYNLCGAQCSCGYWVCPAVQFTRSRIEKRCVT